MNIAVVYSKPTRRLLEGPFADTDTDTQDSAREIANVLSAVLVPVDPDHIEKISTISADLIFNLIEWTGLDLPLSDRAYAEIEKTGIPFTGASRKNFMETSDKISMKKAFDANRLPTAAWQVFTTGSEPIRNFTYPVIIKPALEHCSIGLTGEAVVSQKTSLLAHVKKQLRRFSQPILVEEFIAGREFQVTAIETEKGLTMLPPAEIIYTQGMPFLTYDSRWDDQTADYTSSHVALAQLDPQLYAGIEHLTKRTFRRLGFSDYTRLDIRTRGREIVMLEANSNPGLSDSAEYGMTVSYRAVGWTFSDFIWKIVESSRRRFSASGS